MKLKHALCAITALAAVSHAKAYDHNGRDASVRCNAMRNQFVLNKANVNALVAISCAGLSHTANERHQMQYEDSMTTFHQWSTTGGRGSAIFVKGYCAIPLNELKEGSFERRKIDLKFQQVDTGSEKMDVQVTGVINGKTLGLGFSNRSFLDDQCGNGEQNINRLSELDLGLQFGVPSMQTLVDILRSQSTGISMNLLETESWVQGNVSGYFSGLGLQYQMNQINGRKLGIAAAPSGSGSELRIRSANILDYAEGGGYFEMSKDSFGTPHGFANDREIYRRDDARTQSYPNNHKFQAYSIDGGAAMIGCSSLVFDGELGVSTEADLDTCKRVMAKSKLSKTRAIEVMEKVSREEQQINQARFDQANMIRKVESYIAKNYPASRNYSASPGMHEQGRQAWTQEDIQRGYVVVQRSYQINKETATVSMVEHRMIPGGKTSAKRIEVPMTGMQ